MQNDRQHTGQDRAGNKPDRAIQPDPRHVGDTTRVTGSRRICASKVHRVPVWQVVSWKLQLPAEVNVVEPSESVTVAYVQHVGGNPLHSHVVYVEPLTFLVYSAHLTAQLYSTHSKKMSSLAGSTRKERGRQESEPQTRPAMKTVATAAKHVLVVRFIGVLPGLNEVGCVQDTMSQSRGL